MTPPNAPAPDRPHDRAWLEGEAREVTDAMIDRAAHLMATITHPMFQGDDAWEHAIPTFKSHWRRVARVALAVLTESGR